MAIFSRHTPQDANSQKTVCPKSGCDGQLTEYDTNCLKCGSFFSPCIASGQTILAKQYYTCKTCKHKALQKELDILKLKHCPLCHALLQI